MSLAERLRELAKWLDGEAKDYKNEGCPVPATECDVKANELRTLADYVEGRVVARPSLPPWGQPRALVSEMHMVGSTTDEAVANMQNAIDKRDGRTLP
jgi:hypothetical protein